MRGSWSGKRAGGRGCLCVLPCGRQKTLEKKDVTKGQMCNTVYQYCNPDAQVQSADYSTFYASATLAALTSKNQHLSPQGQLLCVRLDHLSSKSLAFSFCRRSVPVISHFQACRQECHAFHQKSFLPLRRLSPSPFSSRSSLFFFFFTFLSLLPLILSFTI